MQNDTSIENLKVMTEFTRQYGVYSSPSYNPDIIPPAELEESKLSRQKVSGMPPHIKPSVRPGVCFPWEEKVKELPELTGNVELLRKVWEDIDSMANMYIWQILLSF